MIVIGSSALAAHKEFAEVEPNDLDLVGTYEEAESFRKAFSAKVFYPINSGKSVFMKNAQGFIAEIEIAWPNSRAEGFLKWAEANPHHFARMEERNGNVSLWPTLNVLYMLKMSHRYLKDSVHFKKTMDDIRMLRSMGAEITEDLKEYLKQREKETYTYGSPKLNKTKTEFFSGDGIEYKWVHDDIHEAVKHLDRPAYQFFSGGEVWSDMKKFDTLAEQVKLLAVLEESLVLAAERSQLAFPDRQIDPKWSFDKALEKVCTSITSGRFRAYAWENYYKVQDMYAEFGHDYMDRVRRGIETGIVRRVN